MRATLNDRVCCRIDHHGVIKVADFGLTEDMYARNYFRRDKSEGGSEEKVPIKWMAPESIESGIYNERTDAVSEQRDLSLQRLILLQYNYMGLTHKCNRPFYVYVSIAYEYDHSGHLV